MYETEVFVFERVQSHCCKGHDSLIILSHSHVPRSSICILLYLKLKWNTELLTLVFITYQNVNFTSIVAFCTISQTIL